MSTREGDTRDRLGRNARDGREPAPLAAIRSTHFLSKPLRSIEEGCDGGDGLIRVLVVEGKRAGQRHRSYVRERCERLHLPSDLGGVRAPMPTRSGAGNARAASRNRSRDGYASRRPVTNAPAAKRAFGPCAVRTRSSSKASVMWAGWAYTWRDIIQRMKPRELLSPYSSDPMSGARTSHSAAPQARGWGPIAVGSGPRHVGARSASR